MGLSARLSFETGTLAVWNDIVYNLYKLSCLLYAINFLAMLETCIHHLIDTRDAF